MNTETFSVMLKRIAHIEILNIAADLYLAANTSDEVNVITDALAADLADFRNNNPDDANRVMLLKYGEEKCAEAQRMADDFLSSLELKGD